MAAGERLDPRVEALLAHRHATRVSADRHKWLGDDPEADALLRQDGVAMLLGLVLQRGMPAERVWRIPLHLHRELGHLDPEHLGKMPEAEVEAALRRLPARPRYPGQSATTIVALGRLVHERFGGDGRRVWDGRRMADVLTTLQSLPGVGPGIAHMAIQLLMDEVGYLPESDELPRLDVKADVHVVRVFYRLGIAADQTREASVDAARRLHPIFPGLLDWPAWDIGRRFCRPQFPICGECPLTALCERRGVGDTHQTEPDLEVSTPAPVTDAHSVPAEKRSSVWAKAQDDDFWTLLAKLVGIALESAHDGGTAHRFASVAPLLTTDLATARAKCRAMVNEILGTRLAERGIADYADVISTSVEAGLIEPEQAGTLRGLFARDPSELRLSDAVMLTLTAVRTLGN